MKEKIIKWSSRKIIWNIVLCFVDLAFLLWILYFMMTYPKEVAIGLVALRLFVLFLIIIVGWLLYERIQILLSDKEYLKCTAQGFSYKPHPKKDWQFYSWDQVETLRIKGGRSSRDFYTIEVHFYDKDFINPNSLWNRLRSRFSTTKQSNVLKIPIYLLDVALPRRVFEVMSYFEREWRIEQNRQLNQKSKSKKKERFH